MKDLTTFNLYRVRVSKRDDDGDLREAAELYVVLESSDEANLQIRRLLEQRGVASWTTAPVDVKIDENAETVAAVGVVLGGSRRRSPLAFVASRKR